MLTVPLYSTFPVIKGQLRFIICSYRGGVGNPPPFSLTRMMPRLGRLGRILDRLMLLNFRQFMASNRDFSANPRTLSYLAGLIEELCQVASLSQVTIVLDQAFESDTARPMFDCFGDVVLQNPIELVHRDGTADTTVVVYPDALGLGWGKLERRLLGTNTYLMNGRRRIQLLDVSVHRRLRWHRFLATTRLPELVMGVFVVPLAALLATWDALRGKS